MNRIREVSDANKEIFARAVEKIPGGVNSPVRSFSAVNAEPIVAMRAEGAYLWDANGKKYIDYIQSWGASILGHAHPKVVEAIRDAAAGGCSFGLPTEAEVALAEKICEMVPSVEQVRLVSSGTEATMSAVRLARAFTGRKLLVKFEGCYHGHSDTLLASAGSGVATLGLPGSAGVPEEAVASTIVLPYNDLEAVEEVFLRNGEQIAAVIVEPVAANMGLVPPVDGFLESLRRLTSEHSALLIFDEVITGFRLALGGAQERFGILPDITTLGKVLGGGLPLAAFGGSRDLMESLAPLGDVYQAGTLSGNPLATAAALAVLGELDTPLYSKLEGRVEFLADAIADGLSGAGLDHSVQRSGTLFGLFFTSDPVVDYVDAEKSDRERYASYFREALVRGVLLPPSPFEAIFVTSAHSKDDLEKTGDMLAAAAAAV